MRALIEIGVRWCAFIDALIVKPCNPPHAKFYGTHAIRPAVGMMVLK
jgi:hypothetical protein